MKQISKSFLEGGTPNLNLSWKYYCCKDQKSVFAERWKLSVGQNNADLEKWSGKNYSH